MTIASDIAEKVAYASAVTLYGGYAIGETGNRIMFPTGHMELEKRNANGRVIAARFHYADGSRLLFSWSESHGPKYVSKKPKL